MVHAPLVSVVMPSFNQARFISQSIDSVLGQDYTNLELVVGDGGSTDDTVELLRRRSEQDPRLRWFSRKDSGPAEAINNALAMTRGTIVGWLNSDDLYTPGAIGRAVHALERQPDWIMVYGKGEYVDAAGRFLRPYPTLPPSTPVERFSSGCFICQPTVFFRSTMPLLLGGLDASLKASFDFDYWLRAFRAFPGRIGFIDEVQARSRLHEECITRKMRQTVAIEGMTVIARHLGEAPVHWLTTCIEELLAAPSDSSSGRDLQEQILALLREAEGKVARSDLEALEKTVRTHARFAPSSAQPAQASPRHRTKPQGSERLGKLEQVYLEVAHEAVCAFYKTIRSRADDGKRHDNELVGLLTFPNSGTSWFLQLAQSASRIRNHTAYEHEATKTNGMPSRGAFLLNSPNLRNPQPHEPSLVKSHVAYYGDENIGWPQLKKVDAIYRKWRIFIPPNCRRHIRLVRNPFDNLRARYHLHCKLRRKGMANESVDFRDFFKKDLYRYFLWHACCNKLACDHPMFTVHYADLLDERNAPRTLLSAMNFAGYDVNMQDTERAFKEFPPIYKIDLHIPTHLKYYTEEDIIWISREIRRWVKEYGRQTTPGWKVFRNLKESFPGRS